MSRAFVKEDVEIAERPMLRRSASGLPPGAINYMTAAGARRLERLLEELRRDAKKHDSEITHLERVLASAAIVETQPHPDMVTFGATVTLRDADGKLEVCHIVGADETDLEPANVSWVSPMGRALLDAKPGQVVKIPGTKAVWTLESIG